MAKKKLKKKKFRNFCWTSWTLLKATATFDRETGSWEIYFTRFESLSNNCRHVSLWSNSLTLFGFNLTAALCFLHPLFLPQKGKKSPKTIFQKYFPLWLWLSDKTEHCRSMSYLLRWRAPICFPVQVFQIQKYSKERKSVFERFYLLNVAGKKSHELIWLELI